MFNVKKALLGTTIIMMTSLVSRPAYSQGHDHGGPEHEPVSHEQSHKDSAATEHVVQKEPGLFTLIYQEFMLKLEHLRNLDQDNDAYRKRMALLEVENAHLLQDNAECREGHRAEVIKTQAKAEGGVESARTIASLNPSDAKLLSKPPKYIFQAAAKAFEAGDFETSARAFTFLADNQENDAFQTPQTFYLAGVSLFKVGNFKTSKHYFETAYSNASEKHGVADLSYAPRALAWIALCHQKLGDKASEKKVLHELIQKYPKSKEARRFNREA